MTLALPGEASVSEHVDVQAEVDVTGANFARESRVCGDVPVSVLHHSARRLDGTPTASRARTTKSASRLGSNLIKGALARYDVRSSNPTSRAYTVYCGLPRTRLIAPVDKPTPQHHAGTLLDAKRPLHCLSQCDLCFAALRETQVQLVYVMASHVTEALLAERLDNPHAISLHLLQPRCCVRGRFEKGRFPAGQCVEKVNAAEVISRLTPQYMCSNFTPQGEGRCTVIWSASWLIASNFLALGANCKALVRAVRWRICGVPDVRAGPEQLQR